MANPIVEVTIPADFSGDLNYFCDVMSHCEAFNMVGVVHVKGGSIPGDFNDDGQVNGGDLGGLLAAWGTNNPRPTTSAATASSMAETSGCSSPSGRAEARTDCYTREPLKKPSECSSIG